jgi:hypothetical protein
MNSNGRAIGTTDSLAETMTPEQQQYAELLQFQKEYQNGTRNVFVYAPERFNTDLVGPVAAIANDGLYVPSSPDLFPISHALTSLTNRRLDNLTGFSLSISTSFQVQNGFFTDTSTTNINTNIYFVLGYVPYSTITGQFGGAGFGGPSSYFYPIFQANMGQLVWNKANRQFNFSQFNQTYNLLDTIPNRPAGVLYRDFTNNPSKITDQDLESLKNDQLMLTIGLTFEAQSNFSNTDFIQNQDILAGYPGLSFRVSYAFNYYALLANF